MNTHTNIPAINILKGILLLGVVAIHCNPLAVRLESSVSTVLLFELLRYPLSYCVPAFFAISGFLFFRNVEKFSFEVYRNKIRSRIKTLLIPYLLWITFAGMLTLTKGALLGLDGGGIYVDGSFSLTGFLCGYWDSSDGLAFALWFLRNLFIFQLLTPIFYFFGCHVLLVIATLLMACCGIDFYGGEYFLFGCFIGIRKYSFMPRRHIIYSFLIFIAVATGVQFIPVVSISIEPLLKCACTVLIIPLAMLLATRKPRIADFFDKRSSAFFFIYAIHGLYAAAIMKFCVALIPAIGIGGVVVSSIAALIINLAVSSSLFLLMYRFAPHLLNILTGSRSMNFQK